MNKKYLHSIIKFFGSVKIAVLSMLTLIVVIAFGTIVESRYNADYAKMLVYQNPWFNALIVLILINVTFATITRWPWKKHHIGFLITHLGLVCLFGGGMVTNIYGIDGSLFVIEGEANDQFTISEYEINVARASSPVGSSYEFPRHTSPLNINDLADLNAKVIGIVSIHQYEPYVQHQPLQSQPGAGGGSGVAIQFNLKSNFFDVDESMDSDSKPGMQMGPAQFRLVEGPLDSKNTGTKKLASASKPAPAKAPEKKSKASKKIAGVDENLLLVLKGSEVVAKIPVVGSLPIEQAIAAGKIEITRIFNSATVGEGGLKENPGGAPNPAVEIKYQLSGKSGRDVLFAKFPDFSLTKEPNPEYKFKYEAKGVAADVTEATENASGGSGMPAGHPPVGAGAVSAPAAGDGPSVTVYYQKDNKDKVRIEFSKAGDVLGSQVLKVGQSAQAPWMGMNFTLKSIGASSGGFSTTNEYTVTPIPLREKENVLPPAAIRVGAFEGGPESDQWIIEGDQKMFPTSSGDVRVYFGRKILRLPFAVNLKKFTKEDYFGTEMAKSYESLVEVDGMAGTTVIKMNEPLKKDGYTLYQSSYQQQPGGKFASIFSVNRDPGRPIKYAGGIFLAIGIILYTVMRSKWYQQRRLQESKK